MEPAGRAAVDPEAARSHAAGSLAGPCSRRSRRRTAWHNRLEPAVGRKAACILGRHSMAGSSMALAYMACHRAGAVLHWLLVRPVENRSDFVYV